MSRRPRLAVALLALGRVAFLGAVLAVVDLAPRVERDFFFASDDPQLEASAEIEALFPSSPQILVRAAGDVDSPEYLEQLGRLTERLGQVPGVMEVRSLTKGPSSPAAAARSPLWSRLLLPGNGEGGAEASTLLLEVEEADLPALVSGVEAVLADVSAELAPSASGVPFVVELIRRHLLRDLRVFSLVSLLVFALAAALIYRSLPIVLGTILSCLTASGLTLLALSRLQLAIGLLTANLATIVFVLTFSHIVFLTSNWRRAAAGLPAERVREAARETFPASFWCMATTLLGFTSLLLASARPLRELGMAGALGTAGALAVAYGLFPFFLRQARPPAPAEASEPASEPASRRTLGRGTALLGLLVLAVAPGLLLLSTDPSLLAYFDRGSELRQGLAAIDRDGGSSPLTMVVEDPGGAPLHEGEALARLEAVQAALEEDPAVGSALSLPVLLAEAKRQPLAVLLSTEQLLTLLDSAAFDRIARSFVTADRRQALVFLRMHEAAREASRREVVERLVDRAEASGLEVTRVGGLYDLQGRLSQLVASSLIAGLGGLTVLFTAIAFAVSRQVRTTLVMVAAMLAVPVLAFGVFGYLRWPLDVIVSPAGNVAVGLGIDSMIHLVLRRRRLASRGLGGRDGWMEALRQMARPILTATAVVAGGFGVFALSSFPPTRHFGIAIVLGTAAAAGLALVALPHLASGSSAQASAAEMARD